MRCISTKSKTSPRTRRTGDSIEITPTGVDTRPSSARDLGGRLGEREGRPLRGERDQGQPAQLLRSVTRVVVNVAFPLYEHAAAAPRQDAESEVVGKRSARQE